MAPPHTMKIHSQREDFHIQIMWYRLAMWTHPAFLGGNHGQWQEPL